MHFSKVLYRVIVINHPSLELNRAELHCISCLTALISVGIRTAAFVPLSSQTIACVGSKNSVMVLHQSKFRNTVI
jgi:hypothetical protein